MKKILMLFFCTLILYGCGDETESQKITVETKKPEVEISQPTLSNYEVLIKARVLTDGGQGVKETGFCYNEDKDGAPSLENSLSRKVLVTYSPEKEYETMIKLHPETSYQVIFYAINDNGVSYSEIQKIQTQEKDINILLPGSYVVTNNTSHFSGKIKDYNIEIVNENGEFVMYGLMSEPLKAPARNSRLVLELNKIDTVEWKYEFKIPYQQSGLKVNFEGSTYPTLVVNGGWLFAEESNSFDIVGELTYNGRVEISIKTGYGLVMCDPITHEIKLDNHFPPVELVLGNNTYPGESENYPRPDCLLIRKTVD